MKMKRLSSAALALTMVAGLGVNALANESEIMLISETPNAAPTLTLNGKVLDTAAIPAAEAGLVPMRLIAEADYGYAEWYAEDGLGMFSLDTNSIMVNFADNSVELNFEVVEGVTATVIDGVTFLPATLVDGLEGYSATTAEDGSVTITTPNGDPFVQLARKVMDYSGMAVGMKAGSEELEMMGISTDCFTELVAYLPMMTNPDTLIMGYLDQDIDREAAMATLTEELEAYRQQQEDTFSWYLSHNLPKVENAQIVERDGWVLFLIAEDAEAAAEAFTTAVPLAMEGEDFDIAFPAKEETTEENTEENTEEFMGGLMVTEP